MRGQIQQKIPRRKQLSRFQWNFLSNAVYMFSILSEFSACLCQTRCISGNFFYRLINGYTLANYDSCYPEYMRIEYVVLYRIASTAVSGADQDHFDTDLDPTFYFDTEPGSYFSL
jgi:hypothetical protein